MFAAVLLPAAANVDGKSEPDDGTDICMADEGPRELGCEPDPVLAEGGPAIPAAERQLSFTHNIPGWGCSMI